MAWIPLNDLKRGLDEDRELLYEAFEAVLASGYLVHGPEHRAFEHDLALLVGASHAIGVASGTDALEIALRVAMPAGRDTVVTTANAGGYSSVAARRNGFRIRYADIDPGTHCLDPRGLDAVLDDQVGVVVVTHLYGRAAPVSDVVARCSARGIAVLEDCAQAIGARTPEGAVGSLGDIATFSFYPTKNLGALGDGGAVTTSSDELAAQVRSLRQYGWSDKYTITTPGGQNSRLDELQAAFLRRRLGRLDARNARRREIVARYRAAASSRIEVLEATGPGHVAHLAVVVTEDRAALRTHLDSLEIRSDVHYPVPDHRQPALSSPDSGQHLPVTEALTARIVTLPLFPELTDNEVERVCGALAGF